MFDAIASFAAIAYRLAGIRACRYSTQQQRAPAREVWSSGRGCASPGPSFLSRSAAKFYQNDFVLEEKKVHKSVRTYADYFSFFSNSSNFLKSSSNLSAALCSAAWISTNPRPIARPASVKWTFFSDLVFLAALIKSRCIGISLLSTGGRSLNKQMNGLFQIKKIVS